MDSHAIKNLKLLKKLSLQKSDVLRVEMQGCLGQIDQLNAHSKKLTDSHLHEEAFAAQAEHVETTMALDAYRSKQKRELAQTSKAINEMERSYELLRDQLGELFSEQKSYEITIDDLKKKELEREKQEELQFFDEVSMQRWRSK